MASIDDSNWEERRGLPRALVKRARASTMLLIVALSWAWTSHALAYTSPFDEELDDAPACDPIESQCDMRWGLVVESALRFSREESQFNPRAAVRFNFPLTDVFEARTDFMLGGFPGFLDPEPGASYSGFGAGLRADLQLNVGSVYTLGVGADLAVALGGGLVGAHLSILGFRFGPKREFFLNLPQQLWLNIGSSTIILEQVLSVSYLFDF